jgi:hypothetical protein
MEDLVPTMGEQENLLNALDSDPSASLPWNAFCDVLDGVPWDTVAARLPAQVDQANSNITRLRERLAGPGQYFYEADPLRRAQEIFWLKLCLFDQLCRQVASLHRRIQRPLLTLDPAHIRIGLPEEMHSYVPLRWSCVLMIQQSKDASRPVVDDMPLEMASVLHSAPQHVDPGYVSPFIREWPLGREVSATAVIQSADPIPDEDLAAVRGLVRVQVIADDVVAGPFSRQDVFRLLLPLKTGKKTEVRVWARKVEVAERGIVVSGVTDGLAPEIWRAFEGESQYAMSDARVMVYQSYAVSSDLYSLGMLLLRALLGSDQRRWESVVASFPTLLDGLAPAVQGVDPSDFSVLHGRIRERLCEWQDLFIQPDISDDLWWDALTLALRALATIPGFSYAVPRSSEDDVADRSGIDALSQDVAHLIKRTRMDLFEAHERDRTIRMACDRLLADLGMG